MRFMGVVTLHVALALLQVIASVTGHNICTDGPCISVYDCPPLLKLLQSKFLTPSIVSTLRQAQCNPPTGRSASFVCCASAAARAGPVARPSLARNAAATRPAQSRGPSYGRANQLPATCGVEPTTRKIIGGADVALDEFPWMAILEYERRDGSWTLECGGFLINPRYVLTAAHCVVGKDVENVGKLVNVRLGDYNTETETDCVQLDNGRECADAVQHYDIEAIIPHPEYLPSDVAFYERENDIALIRLSNNVKYTEFVAPVCLPSASYRGTPLGRNYTVAGWGRTLVSKRSPVKLKVSVPAADFEQCRNFYVTRKISLVASQLCAGGTYAQDSCTGDSGGPLMSHEQNRWIAEGIVSFGVGCGLERPSVYTKVQAFLPWIQANLRP